MNATEYLRLARDAFRLKQHSECIDFSWKALEILKQDKHALDYDRALALLARAHRERQQPELALICLDLIRGPSRSRRQHELHLRSLNLEAKIHLANRHLARAESSLALAWQLGRITPRSRGFEETLQLTLYVRYVTGQTHLARSVVSEWMAVIQRSL